MPATSICWSRRKTYSRPERFSRQGYVRFEPQARLTPRRLRSYLAHQKDFSYEHPWPAWSSICIGGFSGIRSCPPMPVSRRLARTGSTLGPSASDLPAPRLLLYLCVHGALDGWLRLKWLADIGALLHTMTPEQLGSAATARQNSKRYRNSAPLFFFARNCSAMTATPTARGVWTATIAESRTLCVSANSCSPQTNIVRYESE